MEMIQRYKQGESATQIAKSLNLFTTSVTRVLRRNGLKTGHKKGPEHPMWKGGRVLKNGYPSIWSPKHHRKNNCGYVKEHVLIMEKELGRKIKKTEHIHHIDFTRDNNNPLNLWVCSGSNHKKAERSIQKLVKELLERNVLKFNRVKGVYEL